MLGTLLFGSDAEGGVVLGRYWDPDFRVKVRMDPRLDLVRPKDDGHLLEGYGSVIAIGRKTIPTEISPPLGS